MEVSITVPASRPYKQVLQFKIALIGTDIWRRVQVPESYTFFDLHVAIQNSMGWQDSHLHCFEVKNSLNKKVRIECPWTEPIDGFDEEEFEYDTEVFLKDYLSLKNKRFSYEYDFGDSWHHQITLEKILEKEKDVKYPQCLDGALSCPPEDCGGTSGYFNCIEAIKVAKRMGINVKKRFDDSIYEIGGVDAELLLWLDGWLPDRFDPKKVKFQSPRKRFMES